jgi:hypothetical protein
MPGLVECWRIDQVGSPRALVETVILLGQPNDQAWIAARASYLFFMNLLCHRETRASAAWHSTRCSLPGAIHPDPADRIIAATTRHLGAVLVTADNLLLDYSTEGHLNVMPAEQ